MVLSIHSKFKEGKILNPNYKNIYPFFNKKACIPLPKNIKALNYIVDKTEILIKKVLGNI